MSGSGRGDLTMFMCEKKSFVAHRGSMFEQEPARKDLAFFMIGPE